ncbi:hypothetical protein KJ761_00325 [Patescibacteria group bacterium]|nr:hypothetical protein [Patescibacteria group bacterium]
MFKLFVIGEIIGFTGVIIALGFGQEWGLYVTIGGALIALPSILTPKPKKEEENQC